MSATISHLIINTPYAEPGEFWKYHRETRSFSREQGRRPAGYVVATPGAKGFDDMGTFVEIPLVNLIRPRVQAWRGHAATPYAGVTGTTRRLLEHWRNREERGNPFFFCQLEALETLIWLAEAPEEQKVGLHIPGDGGAFRRLCSKMATGTGKTVVMAQLIAWHVLNKVANPTDGRFSKNVFLVAPGLTVKSRLQVLNPHTPGNYYEEFDVVPGGLREQLRQGRVLIHNWHRLDWETEAQATKRRTVDKRGAKSLEAWTREVLGELKGAANLLVINDEAHHAWRLNPEAKKAKIDRALIEEATKWVGGLDRIHKARRILICHDFSATPFAPSGKQSSEEALFPWIVSDFGLNDAIESGLVKTPRVVIRDDGKYTKEYKSRYYHLYMDDEVRDDVNRAVEEHVPLPDLLRNAYALLGNDWLATANSWKQDGHRIPPVIITVANRTETAARIKYAFDRGRIPVPELCAPERTLHIDSKVLNEAEARDDEGGLETPESEGDEEPMARKLTKKEQAELLRRTVDTVGRMGEPGEQIQNVISVGMLSEGWDAKTVTHILGLRAFSSQLLCEQVVGRGLRRTSYEVNKEGLFEPEYVNIFGVPFTFLPHEDSGDTPPPPPKPKTRIEALREREAEFGIRWPNILRIDRTFRPRLSLDLAKMKPLPLNASDTALRAELAAVVEGKPNLSQCSEIDLEKLGRRFRLQKVVFEVAAQVFDQIRPTWSGGKPDLLGQVIGLVEHFLASGKIAIDPPLFFQDALRRRILLTLNMQKIVQHVFEQIAEASVESITPVFDTNKPIRSTGDMLPWYSGKPCEPTKKSHVNFVVFDSTWEATEAFHIERSPHVAAWAKNDHLGFEVIYIFRGVVHKYRPDFLIRLANGTHLVLEVKGKNDAEAKAKHAALGEWVAAVNQHGGFGKWRCDVSLTTSDIATKIGQAMKG